MRLPFSARPLQARQRCGVGHWLGVLAWAPFLVPVGYLMLVLWLQPSQHLGDPSAAPRLGRLLYDDYDWTAAALRGLNAQMGRIPGRLDDPCTEQSDADAFDHALGTPQPLRPRYFLEYPATTLLFFRLGHALDHDPIPDPPAALLDACHNRVVEHLPADENQRVWWGRLRRAIRLFEVAMIGCLLSLMLVLKIGYAPLRCLPGPTSLMLILPGALYFSLNRFDVWPALLTALGFAFLGRKRHVTSGVCFGAAAMIKVYPVLFMPMILRYLMPNRHDTGRWLAGFGGALVLLGTVPVVTLGWAATLAPYRYQLSRPPEGLTFFGLILPGAMAAPTTGWKVLRLAAVILPMSLLIASRPRDLASVQRRAAVILIVFLSFQVFYSPQWILWLLPILLPLLPLHRALAALVVALDLVTYLTFPVLFDHMAFFAKERGYEAGYVTLVAARFFLFAALTGLLLWSDARPRSPAIGNTRPNS